MNTRDLELIYGLTNRVIGNMKDKSLYTDGQMKVANAMQKLNEAFAEIGISSASTLDIVDRKNVLAMKVWDDEDIKNQAEEMGYEPTDALIQTIKNSGMLKYLSECNDAEWNVISNAIREALSCNGPCNTELHYTYRDANNFKKSQCVIVKGLITSEQENIITSCMEGNENEELYFIPSQLGMPEERFDKLTSADHCWFEFDYFAHSEKLNTMDGLTVEELVEYFQAAKGKWDDVTFGLENPEIFCDDEDEEEDYD